MSALMDNKEGMNEQKDRKTDGKTTQGIEEENKTVRVPRLLIRKHEIVQ